MYTSTDSARSYFDTKIIFSVTDWTCFLIKLHIPFCALFFFLHKTREPNQMYMVVLELLVAFVVVIHCCNSQNYINVNKHTDIYYYMWPSSNNNNEKEGIYSNERLIHAIRLVSSCCWKVCVCRYICEKKVYLLF